MLSCKLLCRLKDDCACQNKSFGLHTVKKHEKWRVAEWETRLLWPEQRHNFIYLLHFTIRAKTSYLIRHCELLVRHGLSLGQYLAPILSTATELPTNACKHTYGYGLTILPVIKNLCQIIPGTCQNFSIHIWFYVNNIYQNKYSYVRCNYFNTQGTSK
jgi:hypothetical protein